MPIYQSVVDLPCPSRTAFDFFARPANLVLLLAPSVRNFEYQLPERIEVGSHLQFRLQQFGLRIELVHEVAELVDQQRIRLEQRNGPFRKWRHEYSFADSGEAQTTLTECVDFEGPGGFLGMLVTNAKLLEQLKHHIPRAHSLLKERLALPSS